MSINAAYSSIWDKYEHSDETVEYILENVLYDETLADKYEEFKNLRDLYNSVLLNPCECTTNQCSECFHGGNYSSDHENSAELILSKLTSCDLIYECNSLCKCNRNECQNRLVQHGPRKSLKIVDSLLYKSKGVITTEDISKGAFICEYAGELLTRTEALRRIEDNEKSNNMNYILCLKEKDLYQQKSDNAHLTIVDPSQKGNIGRYLNHSCNPNCEIYSVRVDCPLPKIAIFAKRKIENGEELTFHYSGGIKSDSQKKGTQSINTIRKFCLCGDERCEIYLPNEDF